jgi:C4-dicarboxylate-specific signal transduction histidine kinase
MTAEIRRTVKSTVNMQELRTILKAYEIDCEIVVPDEACYVFGHELDLVQAVANLVENLEHAFENHPSSDRKARIEITKHLNLIRFAVIDNGRANFPVTARLGLQQVDSIVSSFGGRYFAPRPVENSVYKTEVGFELTAIAEDVIS